MTAVRYCLTEDGVRIAYTVTGEGPALLLPPYFMDSIANDHLPPWADMLARLGAGRRLIRYDSRGVGISQRDVPLTYDGQVLDMEAVVKAAGLERFDLVGWVMTGPTAIAYTARHPETVNRLVLYATWVRPLDVMPEENLRALAALCRTNFPLAAQVYADFAARRQAPGLGLALADKMREAVSGETLAGWLEQIELDLTPLLPFISVPTLVLHPSGDPVTPLSSSQKIAAGIRDARLVVLPGDVNYPPLGDVARWVETITGFLDEGRELPPPTTVETEEARGSLRVVLFTDIVGHTAMFRRLGDEAGRRVLREHERIVREALRAHGGAEAKTMGDGFMAWFTSVTKAVECAVALQRAFAERNETAAEPLHIRVGLNAGEPIAEGDDLFGATVILAARIAAQADGGEILASLAVRELCIGKGFLFADLGQVALRGFEDPVPLFEVRWRE